jgi:hypothetical protein
MVCIISFGSCIYLIGSFFIEFLVNGLAFGDEEGAESGVGG